MSSPEEIRGIHRATILPNQGRGGIGVAEPRTVPETQTKPRRGINPILEGLAVLGILTATGAAVYETIPAVRQTVDQAIGKVFGDEVPSTFDNKLDKGVIGDNNTVKLSASEIQKLPKSDENGKPLRTFPVGISEGEKVQYERKFLGGLVHPGIDIDPTTTRDILKVQIPAGKPIIASSSGYLFEGSGAIILISLDKNGKPSSQLYGFNSVDSFQMTIDAPKLSADNRNGKEWEKGLKVLDGELIAVTTKDVEFEGTLMDSTGQTFYDPRVEGNWNFKTSSSKLVTSQER